MNQTTINFPQRREVKKKQLKGLQKIVYNVLSASPRYRELKNINQLVRLIWSAYGDYSCESITRCARKLRASCPELDTKDNALNRANLDCAYREYNKESVITP